MAAPRRFLSTALLRVAAPATPRVSASITTRVASVAHRSYHLQRRPLTPRATVATKITSRSYSDDAIPGSRQWNHMDIKEQIKANESSDDKPSVIFVDVREPEELFTTGKIPGAINIPITSAVQSFHISDEDFVDLYGFERPAKDAELMFYCKAGVRARSAAGLAQHAGWTNVGEYSGSWIDWQAHNGPVEYIKGKRRS
ncbi:unnamed protein product [Clonostachys rosea f. rosea IK726]|uniref:Uncharacterized protein n=1 Tax=Clonostachys rosea f. rosea IK726 TaxID=1349383 RepID=A0ACA9TDY0_BIOOC|nr:unnamed protein product [Clonostachys rosea f. rosea IK726]